MPLLAIKSFPLTPNSFFALFVAFRVLRTTGMISWFQCRNHFIKRFKIDNFSLEPWDCARCFDYYESYVEQIKLMKIGSVLQKSSKKQICRKIWWDCTKWMSIWVCVTPKHKGVEWVEISHSPRYLLHCVISPQAVLFARYIYGSIKSLMSPTPSLWGLLSLKWFIVSFNSYFFDICNNQQCPF